MGRHHPYLWTVRYRRYGWKSPQQRQFILKAHAHELVRKLRQPPTAGLHGIAELTVIRRQLGPPETVFDLEEQP